MSGSSPLSRGIHSPQPHRRGRNRIIPALAGNTRSARNSAPEYGDHPRSRGEYLGLDVDERSHQGSSPLSRGILPATRHGQLRHRIIPALAGNTMTPHNTPSDRTDHPRSRGEYGPNWGTRTRGSGSSPLSRGIRTYVPGVKSVRRIIPALAGNTCFGKDT